MNADITKLFAMEFCKLCVPMTKKANTALVRTTRKLFDERKDWILCPMGTCIALKAKEAKPKKTSTPTKKAQAKKGKQHGGRGLGGNKARKGKERAEEDEIERAHTSTAQACSGAIEVLQTITRDAGSGGAVREKLYLDDVAATLIATRVGFGGGKYFGDPLSHQHASRAMILCFGIGVDLLGSGKMMVRWSIVRPALKMMTERKRKLELQQRDGEEAAAELATGIENELALGATMSDKASETIREFMQDTNKAAMLVSFLQNNVFCKPFVMLPLAHEAQTMLWEILMACKPNSVAQFVVALQEAVFTVVPQYVVEISAAAMTLGADSSSSLPNDLSGVFKDPFSITRR